MEQIEIFYKCNDEDGLQKAVNAWLIENNGKVEVTRIFQTQSGRTDRHTTVSIFYKTK